MKIVNMMETQSTRTRKVKAGDVLIQLMPGTKKPRVCVVSTDLGTDELKLVSLVELDSGIAYTPKNLQAKIESGVWGYVDVELVLKGIE